MIIGLFDVILTDEQLPVLTQTNEFLLREEVTISRPDILVDLLNQLFCLKYRAEEYVYMLAVNTAMKPIAFFEISHGSVNASSLCSREVFLRLLLCGASGMILVHNHPSGAVEASKEDFGVFRKFVKASELMGIEFHDFIIIGKEYCSFKECGYFDK